MTVAQTGNDGPVEDYFAEALDLIRGRSLFASSERWNESLAVAQRALADAETRDDVHQIIRRFLASVGDRHSFLVTPQKAKVWAETETPDSSTPSARLIDGQVAYMSVGSFESGNAAACTRFASTVQSVIRDIDEFTPRGWVVDLRSNSGGNMWPMLAGLGPLLGDGAHGSFDIVGEAPSHWVYSHGKAMLNDDLVVEVAAPYVQQLSGKLAVAIGPSTGSSGEAIAVAFKGLESVRFFGQRSAGMSTCNADLSLSDGALLFLSTGVFVDRRGQRYPEGVCPDVYCDDPIEEAAQWILGDSHS